MISLSIVWNFVGRGFVRQLVAAPVLISPFQGLFREGNHMKRTISTLSVTAGFTAAALTGLLAGCQGQGDNGMDSGSGSGTQMNSNAPDKHSCKGLNSCKGHGGCQSSDNGCKGKNSCKGQGGCNTMDAQ